MTTRSITDNRRMTRLCLGNSSERPDFYGAVMKVDLSQSLTSGQEHVLALLRNYIPPTEPEKVHYAKCLDLVRNHPDCAERSLKSGHLTGSVWLVNLERDKVLLTHHKKLDKWLQLGGHADGDCDLLAVARREASEESGIAEARIVTLFGGIFDIDVHPIPARRDEPEHLHYDLRFLLQSETEEISISDESRDLHWVKISDLEKYTSEESMLRMRRKWLMFKV